MSALPCGKSQLHIELPSDASSSRIARDAVAEGIGDLSTRERNNLKLLISELVRGPSNGGHGSIVLDAWKVFSGVRVECRADGIASISDVMSIRLFDRLASQWHVGDGFGWFFLQTSARLHDADDVTLFECVAAGDHRAIDVLLYRYREFAVAITQGFKGAGITHDDVEQVAMIGLTKAIVRFDPDRGFKFTTFAAPTIRGELKKWLRSSAWAVHVPRGLQELALHARRAFTEVSQSIGHEASIEELSVALGADPVRVERALLAPLSQQALLPKRDPVIDTMSLESIPCSEDVARTAIERAYLSPALERLPQRERRILYLRFFEDLTQSEIAERLGISQMQVSRLLTATFAEIHAELEPRGSEKAVFDVRRDLPEAS